MALLPPLCGLVLNLDCNSSVITVQESNSYKTNQHKNGRKKTGETFCRDCCGFLITIQKRIENPLQSMQDLFIHWFCGCWTARALLQLNIVYDIWPQTVRNGRMTHSITENKFLFMDRDKATA